MVRKDDAGAPRTLTLKVYTVDRATGERTEPREVHPKGGSVFALDSPWPKCACPKCRSSRERAEQVAAEEKKAGL